MIDVLTHAVQGTKPAHAAQYHLAESDRQKIIAQSPLAKRMAQIEVMRKTFIAKNGDDGLGCTA